MLRNMEKGRVLELSRQITVQEGTVVSQNLVRQERFELSLYSFGDGESISEQVSFGDTFYYIVEGTAQFGPGQKNAEANGGKALLVPHQKPHQVQSLGGLKLLILQVFAGKQQKQKGNEEMYIHHFVQNEVVTLADQIGYESGKIVSRALVQREDMTMTLFAFDAGEGVSTHASAGDAMVVVLDGCAEITVDGVTSQAKKGQSIIMPATIPHAVKAVTPYKMLLIVVKPENR